MRQYRPSRPNQIHNIRTTALQISPLARVFPPMTTPRNCVAVTNGIDNPTNTPRYANQSVVQALFRTYSWKTKAALSLVVIMFSLLISPLAEYVVVFSSPVESEEDTTIEGAGLDMLVPLVVVLCFNSKYRICKLLGKLLFPTAYHKGDKVLNAQFVRCNLNRRQYACSKWIVVILMK